VPLVQLLSLTGKPYDFVVSGDPRTYADLSSPQGLHEIASYADGIGPDASQIVPRDATNHILAPTSLIDDAHRAGLIVHPYTFRRENNFLPEEFRQGNPAHPEYLRAPGDITGWMTHFYMLGVDGFFTDNSDIGVAVRQKLFDQP